VRFAKSFVLFFLISTGLQPGDSCRSVGAAASAAFGLAEKPLKRLVRSRQFNTELKPGANERPTLEALAFCQHIVVFLVMFVHS
jgi:hypothetical protein